METRKLIESGRRADNIVSDLTEDSAGTVKITTYLTVIDDKGKKRNLSPGDRGTHFRSGGWGDDYISFPGFTVPYEVNGKLQIENDNYEIEI